PRKICGVFCLPIANYQDHLLVMDEQKVTGIVTKSDILRIMRIKAAFGGRLRP
ncbi:hypothetical protein HKBW3S03_02045, partial [Candidatus Hakubella thermalkaliphila]